MGHCSRGGGRGKGGGFGRKEGLAAISGNSSLAPSCGPSSPVGVVNA